MTTTTTERSQSVDKSEPPPRDNNAADAAQSVPSKLWDWVAWAGATTFDGLDFAGEVVANFLGLTQSQYQWILDIQEREKEERRQRRLEARQRRQLRLQQLLEEEQRKLHELEHGDPAHSTPQS
ncbi:hypothetical protein P43SY_001626 [Pythium insidiosum]|uniref:Uncharacterized protein n=1 Tax=Pythium insidiosum TaxID=114742 RepID=A0AAD5M4V1_PYTIN|nr:hypothetical protein P43SY_001626 [Pythium insidiosum]